MFPAIVSSREDGVSRLRGLDSVKREQTRVEAEPPDAASNSVLGQVFSSCV